MNSKNSKNEDTIDRTQKTGTSKERQECQPIHAFRPDKMPTFNLRRRSGNGESLPIHVPSSSSSSSSPSKDFKLLHQQSKRMYSRNATTTLSSSSSSQVICGSFFITTVLFCILLFLSYHDHDDYGTKLYPYGADEDPILCEQLAESGPDYCLDNRISMLSKCPHSCHIHAGLSVDTLSIEHIQRDAIEGYAHLLVRGEMNCIDEMPEQCPQWASEGQCFSKAIAYRCPKSCLRCFAGHTHNDVAILPKHNTTITIDYGVPQHVHHDDPDLRVKILTNIQTTREYMIDHVFGSGEGWNRDENDDDEEEYWNVRKDCRNLDPNCALYAAQGECHGRNDALSMFRVCAPACQACHALEHQLECQRRDSDLNVLEPGGIDHLFHTLLVDSSLLSNHRTKLLSHPQIYNEEKHEKKKKHIKHTIRRPPLANPSAFASNDEDDDLSPWIVVLDNVLTDDECEWWIEKGHDIGFEAASEITDEVELETGVFGSQTGDGRVSSHAWCDDEDDPDGSPCEQEPTARRTLERLLGLLGNQIPHSHTEPLEIVHYPTGGYFEPHHDLIETQGAEWCGNRILSLYVFLSTPAQGGELVFGRLEDLTITPQKGRVVIWNNVVDVGDLDRLQEGTFHEFKPVRKGQAYGAHWWLHPRETRSALEQECCN